MANYVRTIFLHFDRGERFEGNRYAKIMVNINNIEVYGDHRIYMTSGKLLPVKETMQEINQKIIGPGYLPEEEEEVKNLNGKR